MTSPPMNEAGTYFRIRPRTILRDSRLPPAMERHPAPAEQGARFRRYAPAIALTTEASKSRHERLSSMEAGTSGRDRQGDFGWPLLIVALSVALRLVFVSDFARHSLGRLPWVDEGAYWTRAQEILRGSWLPESGPSTRIRFIPTSSPEGCVCSAPRWLACDGRWLAWAY